MTSGCDFREIAPVAGHRYSHHFRHYSSSQLPRPFLALLVPIPSSPFLPSSLPSRKQPLRPAQAFCPVARSLHPQLTARFARSSPPITNHATAPSLQPGLDQLLPLHAHSRLLLLPGCRLSPRKMLSRLASSKLGLVKAACHGCHIDFFSDYFVIGGGSGGLASAVS